MPDRSGSQSRGVNAVEHHLVRRAIALITLTAISGSLVLGVASPTSASSAGPSSETVDAFITQLMRKHRVPGLAVALIDDGRVSYAAGYVTAVNERAVTPDTPFMLGSITKAFTAVAVLQLVERRRLDLDAPVRTYLPWFEVADRASSATITVRHLLNHTSGLSELGYNHVPDHAATLEQSVRALRTARPTARPGARFQYFNPNYAVLALLVEAASGEAFGAYLDAHIFQPLEMTHSFADVDEAIAAGMAQGHTKLFGFSFPRHIRIGPSQVGYGHLVASVADVSRFALAISNGGVFQGHRVLSEESVALMRAAPADGPESTYGMGWNVWTAHGTSMEGHSGADETFMSNLALLPEEGTGYVWLMNQQNAFDPVRSELDAGLTDILRNRQPRLGRASMSGIGRVALGVFLFGLTLAILSMMRLRSWVDRSRRMSTSAILRRILPRIVIPLLILWSMYHVLGELVTGRPIAFNFRYIGAYYAPEAALLLALAVAPALAEGVFMSVAAVFTRFTSAPRSRLRG
jgi:CubicO group peptidase (beta-lactamase class C family)